MERVLNTRLSLLGGVAVHLEDGFLVTDLPQAVQRFVALLGLAGRPGRSCVAGQLWPEVPEGQAQRRLRTTLWRVQKTLPGLVETFGGALGLNPTVRLDVQELTEWGRVILDPGAPLDACLHTHPGIYRDLLPGWYDDWLLLERERLRQLRTHVWEALADKLTRAGRFGEAVDAAHQAIRAAPLRERAHRALIRAHAAEGDLGEALLAYQRFEEQLADELGLAPSVQLETLVRELVQAGATRTHGDRQHGRAETADRHRHVRGSGPPGGEGWRAAILR